MEVRIRAEVPEPQNGYTTSILRKDSHSDSLTLEACPLAFRIAKVLGMPVDDVFQYPEEPS
jgi:hypothetical protein